MSAHENFPATPENPLPDAEVNARLAQYGVCLKRSPGKEKWPEGWWPGDDPVQIDLGSDSCLPPHGGGIEGGGHAGIGEAFVQQAGTPTPGPSLEGGEYWQPIHPAALFDAPARVRFLDALACHGNVRAAAARVGVSRETVYRARRRYVDFARAWDAALVHARVQSEQELATRATEGVATPVFLRGEHVATFYKHDACYLLAHLARLDRKVETNPDAEKRAECFDQLLAAMVGHEAPEDFIEAVESARERSVGTPADVPPSREEYRRHARCEAIFDAPEPDLTPEERDEHEELEAEEMARADEEAGEAWDAWHAAGAALVDRVLAGENPAKSGGDDSVRGVNTPAGIPPDEEATRA